MPAGQKKVKTETVKTEKVKTEKVSPIVPKKRGRKPKGGKIITITEQVSTDTAYTTNVIVHLKCKNNDVKDELTSNMNSNYYNTNNNIENNDINNDNTTVSYEQVTHKKEFDDSKNIHEKLKRLQVNLHNNTVCETESACFWCTYNFSNLPIAIPKFEINKTYHVYGCFCSPECATAYLMAENIDSSIRYERYHLLCYIYTKVYDYKTNIKPAPDPHYTLKKYFGNLTIDEYRQLFNSHRYLFIIDKPITRELPELHEEYKNESKFSYSNKNQIIYQTFTN
jgi:hypothetical protein